LLKFLAAKSCIIYIILIYNAVCPQIELKLCHNFDSIQAHKILCYFCELLLLLMCDMSMLKSTLFLIKISICDHSYTLSVRNINAEAKLHVTCHLLNGSVVKFKIVASFRFTIIYTETLTDTARVTHVSRMSMTAVIFCKMCHFSFHL
jgi:hypothetical protein